jgi:hypothetical protein
MNSWNTIGGIGSLALGLWFFSLDLPEPLKVQRDDDCGQHPSMTRCAYTSIL